MQTFKTLSDAIKSLPDNARWSCCFGNPGEGGYAEAYNTDDGTTYWIRNGSWIEISPFTWTVEKR